MITTGGVRGKFIPLLIFISIYVLITDYLNYVLKAHLSTGIIEIHARMDLPVDDFVSENGIYLILKLFLQNQTAAIGNKIEFGPGAGVIRIHGKRRSAVII